MNAILRILPTFIILGLAAFAKADGPTTQPSAPEPSVPPHATTRVSVEILEHLQSKLKDVTTVQADFVEKKNLAVLNHTLTITGHFAIQKPDKFIWIVDQPVRYAIRVEGDEVQQWDEDTNHVDVIHLGGDPTFKAIAEQMQAWFLGDYEALAKNYTVDVLSENPLSLRYAPLGDSMAAKIIKQLDLTFAADERYIDKIAVTESGGDTTILEFVHTQLNQPIKDDAWRMPPNER